MPNAQQKYCCKVGRDVVTSAICKHQQRFEHDIQYSGFVFNFNNIFSIEHLYQAGQAMNSLPSQILNVSDKQFDSNSFSSIAKKNHLC